MVLQYPVITEGSLQKANLIGSLYLSANAKVSSKGAARDVKSVSLTFLSWPSFPGLFDHLVIAWAIRTANIICQIIDFHGTCDQCSYYVLLLYPKYGSA